MKNNFIYVVLAAFTLGSACRKSEVANSEGEPLRPELQLQGRDIREVRNEFLEKGFYVSEIVDQIGEGKRLSMTVDLDGDEKSFVDTFGYVTGIDLAPWEQGKITHLRIRADMDGKIVKVQPR